MKNARTDGASWELNCQVRGRLRRCSRWNQSSRESTRRRKVCSHEVSTESAAGQLLSKNSSVGRPCYSLAVLRLQLAPAVPKLRITFESRLSRICRCSWSALSQACIWILLIDVPTCQEPSTSMLCRNHHRPLSSLLPPSLRSEERSILLAQVSACSIFRRPSS